MTEKKSSANLSRPNKMKQKFSLYHTEGREAGLKSWMAPYADEFIGCENVLDMGCGPGLFLEILKERGISGIGFDHDPEMVAICQGKGLNARVANETALSGYSEEFDGIHLGHIIEHMDGEAMVKLLETCVGALRPGGLLLIRTPNWQNETVRSGGFWLDHTHVRPYPLELLDRIFQDLGLDIIRKGCEPGGWNDIYILGKRPGLREQRYSLEFEGPANRVCLPEVMTVKWEGSQFVNHSLALVNRELCIELASRQGIELSLIPYEPHEFGPEEDPARFGPIADRLRKALSGAADYHVRHQWPPNFTPPPEGHWIIIQPWEFGALPKSWVEPMETLVDELWVPSNHVRDVYIKSGITPDKVFVVPNGVNYSRFNPEAAKLKLNTDKRFRFLFVGGTILRKGIDVLLSAYGEAFAAKDDVCMVIKDMGGGSFYRGQNASKIIEELKRNPDSPEILYLTERLNTGQMAGLYTACDCLVHPYRGEGFGLPVAEAMACGLPVIVTRGGACDDFCSDEITYLIDSRVRPVQLDGYVLCAQGWLLEPDGAHLIDLLRFVYEHPGQAAEKGAMAARHIRKKVDWRMSTDLIIERLRALKNKPVRRYAGSLAREVARTSKAPQEIYQTIQQSMKNKKAEEVIAELEMLTESYPQFALAHNDLGVLNYTAGNKAKAHQFYEKAVQLDPDNIVFQKNLADFLFVEKGRVVEALKIYVNILAANPQDVETLLITGHICTALKKFDDAQEFYERVLALEPDNEDASKNLQALSMSKREQSSARPDSINDMSAAGAKIEPMDLNPEKPENRQSKPRKTVSIVISLDGIQNRVKECLKSIQMHTAEPHELLLIDRGATKGMLKWARQIAKDKDHYHIIESVRQAGWAESINQAIQIASADIIVLIHNDVVVPERWLKAFKMCIKLEPNIGVIGPMSNRAAGIQQLIHSEEFDRIGFESAAKAFFEQYQYRRVTARKLSVFCLAFRRELPDKIGYFDDQFFSEEAGVEDFCNRAASGGYQNLIAADLFVYHYDRHPAKKNASKKKSVSHQDSKKCKEKWNGTQNPEVKAFQTALFLESANESSHKGQNDQAVEILLNAIGIQPAERRLYLELAAILLAAKRFHDAKDALMEMPSADDHQQMRKAELLGYAEEGLENFSAAQAYIEQVLAMNPERAPALNLKGILAYRNNDRHSAEQYFKQAIASDPGCGEPYTNLGMLSLEADRPQDALAFFEKAFRLTPADIDIATNYHSWIAEIGEYRKAENLAREAGALYPNNQKIKYMLIDFLIQQGKYEMAMSEIEDAIIKFGFDDGILDASLKLREKLGPMTIKKHSKRVPVSLCMIVKDEEKYLAKCLASVKPIVDEMIIVDTGSSDRSRDIAISFGARVYDYSWENDFAAARNFSVSKASGQWILILDGDEVISPLDYEHFNKIVIKKPKAPVAYSITTRNYNRLANIVGWVPNDGRYPEEEASIGWLPSEKVRLFYGKDQIWFEGAVHELVDPVLKRNGIKIKKCSIPVHHFGRLDKEKLNRKGEIYFDIGQKKLSEMGGDINALRELAIQATILEKNQQALELWQKLLALNPDPKLTAIAYINMGTIYNRLGKFEKALAAGKKAVENDPDLKEARYNHAMAELLCGNAQKAIGILEDLLGSFPEYPPAQFMLSAAYCCAGQKENGLDGIRKLKNAPLGAHLAMPCIELAESLLAAKKMEYALWLLGAAIECDIVNKEMLDLFTECIKMKDKTQKISEISSTGLTDRQPIKFENLPQ